MRIVAGATVTVVVVLVSVIVATVWFLRFKHQDDVDKKSSNHLELPLEYASNEGKFFLIYYKNNDERINQFKIFRKYNLFIYVHYCFVSIVLCVIYSYQSLLLFYSICFICFISYFPKRHYIKI